MDDPIRARARSGGCPAVQLMRKLTAGAIVSMIAAAGLALAVPASADAATIALRGGVLEVIGSSDRDLLNVEERSDGLVRVDVDFGTVVLTPDTCGAPSTFGTVICEAPDRVVARLGGGEDQVQLVDFPIQVDLGSGDDTAMSGAFSDAIAGGPGRDTVSYPDRIAGSVRRNGAPIAATLNGLPDDGESGEGDNIAADVEVLEGSSASDHMVGDDGPQELRGNGGDDMLEGAGGADLLKGGEGPDSLDGGAGDDELRGEVDGDRITGGPGRDVIRADDFCTLIACGYGADEVFVRDGETDDVDCGIGPDRAIADAQDLIVGCDIVELPSGPRSPGPRPDPGRQPPSSNVPASMSLRRAIREGIDVTVTCPEGCDADAVARVGRRAAGRLRLGRGRATIGGTGTRRVQPGATVTLKVRLTSKARRRMRRMRTVAVAITVTYRTGGTANRHEHRITLRR
jgi:hypothetical protein